MSKFKKWDLNRKADRILSVFNKTLDRSRFPLNDEDRFNLKRSAGHYVDSLACFSELRYPNIYSQEMEESNHLESIRKSNEDFSGRTIQDYFNGISGDVGLNHEIYARFPELNLAAMYKIIDRGGSKSGPRRAALFAEDFGLNKFMAVQYSLDFSDQYLLPFIGPSLNKSNRFIVFPVNYFSERSQFREGELGKLLFEGTGKTIDEISNSFNNV